MDAGDRKGDCGERTEVLALPGEASLHDFDDMALSAPLANQPGSGAQCPMPGRARSKGAHLALLRISALIAILLDKRSKATPGCRTPAAMLLVLDLPGCVVFQQPPTQPFWYCTFPAPLPDVGEFEPAHGSDARFDIVDRQRRGGQLQCTCLRVQAFSAVDSAVIELKAFLSLFHRDVRSFCGIAGMGGKRSPIDADTVALFRAGHFDAAFAEATQ